MKHLLLIINILTFFVVQAQVVLERELMLPSDGVRFGLARIEAVAAADYEIYYPGMGQDYTSNENFSTSYTYDLNSNITALRHRKTE